MMYYVYINLLTPNCIGTRLVAQRLYTTPAFALIDIGTQKSRENTVSENTSNWNCTNFRVPYGHGKTYGLYKLSFRLHPLHLGQKISQSITRPPPTKIIPLPTCTLQKIQRPANPQGSGKAPKLWMAVYPRKLPKVQGLNML
ncbi:hypothetical protein GQ43DRAFT_108114 [Delitschia confertaspora ATCC 74209]|uniref:Uncharacterized protein n=1 Tax=Delitschia confertaspora ATCC 74209 TaxID=1513339 RepID=A0A9P4MU21_9PLEO|nr:hypothetical protein GQ43DRAFT_108114 [Delitschia confertaspora ATCC 74209]